MRTEQRVDVFHLSKRNSCVKLVECSYLPRLCAYVIAPLALIVLIVSVSIVYVRDSNAPFILFLLALLQIVLFYEYIEISRVWAFDRLVLLPDPDFIEMSIFAKEAIDKYSVSLRELLDSHRIKETLEESSPEPMRFTRDTKQSITDSDEVDTGDKYHRYREIIFSLLLVIIISIIVVV